MSVTSSMSASSATLTGIDPRARIAIRPVHDVLSHQFGVGYDDRDAIIRGDDRRAQIDALHVTFIFADGDAIADSDRSFKNRIKPDAISAAMYCKPKPMPTDSAVKITAMDVRSIANACLSATSDPTVIITYLTNRQIV